MKITIITVVYNNVATIERTILSVLNQSYNNWEYIIVDGGSTDGTLDIVRQYQKQITKWISEPDQGIFHAMNKGVRMASGDVIAFLNSDDWYELDALEYVWHKFLDCDMDILFARIYREWMDETDIRPMAQVLTGNDVYRFCNWEHSATFVKRYLFDCIGEFDLQYRITSDNDWVKKVIEGEYKYSIGNHITTHFSMYGISNQNRVQALQEMKKRDLIHSKSAQHTQEMIRYYNKKIAIHGLNSNHALDDNMCIRNGKLYLFGAGYYGRVCLKQFQETGIVVEGILDNNRERWEQCMDGIRIYNPKEVDLSEATIFMAAIGYEEVIAKQLIECGVGKEQIIDADDLFEWK